METLNKDTFKLILEGITNYKILILFTHASTALRQLAYKYITHIDLSGLCRVNVSPWLSNFTNLLTLTNVDMSNANKIALGMCTWHIRELFLTNGSNIYNLSRQYGNLERLTCLLGDYTIEDDPQMLNIVDIPLKYLKLTGTLYPTLPKTLEYFYTDLAHDNCITNFSRNLKEVHLENTGIDGDSLIFLCSNKNVCVYFDNVDFKNRECFSEDSDEELFLHTLEPYLPFMSTLYIKATTDNMEDLLNLKYWKRVRAANPDLLSVVIETY